jgi:sialidase-1
LDKQHTVTAIELDCGATQDFFADLKVDLPGTWTVLRQKSGKIRIQGEYLVDPGTHKIQIMGSLSPGFDLRKIGRMKCLSVILADGSLLSPASTVLAPIRAAYPLHQRGQFQCHTFRIPAIARANDGALLAVYDMRYLSARDLQGHMDIGLSRSTDGGQTWADPVPVMDMGEFGGKPQAENGCSDPNILVDPQTGEIFVSAVWTHGKPGSHQWTGKGSEPGHDLARSSQFLIVRSTDHGKTWSAPKNCTALLKDPAWYLFAPAPGNGIALSDGTLVMPTQGRDAQGKPFSNIMSSRDHGATWSVSTPARSDTTECAVATLSDGSLLLNMRDNRNRAANATTNGRAISITRDLGKTWTIHPADRSALPEPVCMASMISHALPDGRCVLIFSNPHNKTSRREMTIQISFDDGKSWPENHHIMLDAAGGAYSSLVMIDSQTLGILYESSQADLVFQKIALKELLDPK